MLKIIYDKMAIKNNKDTADFKWIDSLSTLLDSRFRVPGTNFKFGLDPIIGLLPGIGEMTTFTFSSLLILEMAKRGVSGKVVTLMVINVVIDTLVGAIPVLGSIFDFFFKANERNVRLLKKHYQEGKYQGSGKGLIIITLLLLVLLFLGMAYLIFKLISFFWHYLSEFF